MKVNQINFGIVMLNLTYSNIDQNINYIVDGADETIS